MSGRAKDVFAYLLRKHACDNKSYPCLKYQFQRSLFNSETFWNMIHGGSPFIQCLQEALKLDVNCVLIRGGKGLLTESGNTASERLVNLELTQTSKGLNMQFQSALLEFINIFSELCSSRQVTQDEYIHEVVKRFKCHPAAIQAGMGPVQAYNLFELHTF